MGVKLGAMEVMLGQALAMVMIQALVLVMMDREACTVLVGQVMVAVVVTILMEGRNMPKLSYRSCMQVPSSLGTTARGTS